MKIRNGFVSNSSSSSFVALISEDGFGELQNMAEDTFEDSAAWELLESKQVFGKTFYVFENWTDRNASLDEYIEWDDLAKRMNYPKEVDKLQAFFWTLHSRIKQLPKEMVFISDQEWH